MGILDSLRKKTGDVLSTDTIALTPRGKEVAENAGFGGARFHILTQLENGATQVKEISLEKRIPINEVKNTVRDMIQKGWVTVVGVDTR